METDKLFDLNGTTMTVKGDFLADHRHEGEKSFLASLDIIMSRPGLSAKIDLVCAGNISSTVIALLFLSAQKAKEVRKELSVSIAKRNAIAVRVSGLERMVAVQLV